MVLYSSIAKVDSASVANLPRENSACGVTVTNRGDSSSTSIHSSLVIMPIPDSLIRD